MIYRCFEARVLYPKYFCLLCSIDIQRLDVNFSPYRAPDPFVPYLASWVDLEVLLDVPHLHSGLSTGTLSTGRGRLRELGEPCERALGGLGRPAAQPARV